MRVDKNEIAGCDCICSYSVGAEAGSVFSEEKGLEPYLTWKHIFERIQEYLGYLEDDKKELIWFEVEKWSPDRMGRLKNDYDYTVFGTEVCYIAHNDSLHLHWSDFSTDCILHNGDFLCIIKP